MVRDPSDGLAHDGSYYKTKVKCTRTQVLTTQQQSTCPRVLSRTPRLTSHLDLVHEPKVSLVSHISCASRVLSCASRLVVCVCGCRPSSSAVGITPYCNLVHFSCCTASTCTLQLVLQRVITASDFTQEPLACAAHLGILRGRRRFTGLVRTLWHRTCYSV